MYGRVVFGLGFAAICGVPVQYGLYAAAIALIVYAFFASSRHVVTGPSSTIAAVTGEMNGDEFIARLKKDHFFLSALATEH